MIIRPFRESADNVVAWMGDQPVLDYEHGVSDIMASQYWQIPEIGFLEHLAGFFSVLPPSHVLGLSVDSPGTLPETTEVTASLSNVDEFSKHVIDTLLNNGHLLTELHSLYIYSSKAFDLGNLLNTLPDLKNLLLWGCDLDLSFVRHANLEWLSSDSGKPVVGLDMASLPALRGVEFDEVSHRFMDSLQYLKQPNLDHFGVIGVDEMSLAEVLSHPALPKSLSSLYLDAYYTVTSAEELQKCLSELPLKRLCIRDQREHWDAVYRQEYLPQLEHLGIIDAPEDEDDDFADYVANVLINPALPKGIKSLDLHGVRLNDDHVTTLLQQPRFQQLQLLNITYHNIQTQDVLDKLTALQTNGCTVLGLS